NLLGQGLVALGLEGVQAQVAQAAEESPQGRRLDVRLGHEAAQVRLDGRQVLLAVACPAGQRQQAGIGVQQAGTVELVERGEQLAQCQVAEGAKQGKGAMFYTDRSHDVGSFLKLT